MNNSTGDILYSCEDITSWRNALDAYETVLKLKATKERKETNDKDLVALDYWYQHELPKKLNSREKIYLNLDELCHLMKWKLTRGKFRPRLSDLVKANDESTVENTSRKAFECLPDVSSAIRELSKLKAVGPATASAILSAGAPDLVPFMADEAIMAIPGMGEINYNLQFYMKFLEKVSNVGEQLKKKDPEGQWTAHKVELALWTEVMARKYNYSIVKDGQDKENGIHRNEVESVKRKTSGAQESEEREPKKRKAKRK